MRKLSARPAALACAFAGIALAGCGSGGGGSGGSGGSGGGSGGGAAGGLTRSALIAKADAICARTDALATRAGARIHVAHNPDGPRQAFIATALATIPISDRGLIQLRALKPPGANKNR